MIMDCNELQESEDSGEDISTDDDTRDATQRFRGPAAAFRDRTLRARQICQYIDDCEWTNLGVHLYNVLRLQSDNRLKHASTARNSLSVSKSSRKSKGQAWRLPDLWTAWPMPQEDVPRDWEDRSGLSTSRPEWPYYILQASNGSTEALQNILLAIILREVTTKYRTNSFWAITETQSDAESEEDDQSSDVDTSISSHEADFGQSIDVLADDEQAMEIGRSDILDIIQSARRTLDACYQSRRFGRWPSMVGNRRSNAPPADAHVVCAEASGESTSPQTSTISTSPCVSTNPLGLETMVLSRDQAITRARSIDLSCAQAKVTRHNVTSCRKDFALINHHEIFQLAELSKSFDPAVIARARERYDKLL